jgi:uncharacterized phage protein gp47/JayE
VAQNAKITRLKVLNFDTTLIQGMDAYKYSTGLLKRVQDTVDGLEGNQAFAGIKAAGTIIEVMAPLVQKLKFEINITLNQGVALSSIIDDIKNAVSSYVNSTKINEDIVLQEISKRIKLINGVYDLSVVYPASNVVIGAMELGRVDDSNIVIG